VNIESDFGTFGTFGDPKYGSDYDDGDADGEDINKTIPSIRIKDVKPLQQSHYKTQTRNKHGLSVELALVNTRNRNLCASNEGSKRRGGHHGQYMDNIEVRSNMIAKSFDYAVNSFGSDLTADFEKRLKKGQIKLNLNAREIIELKNKCDKEEKTLWILPDISKPVPRGEFTALEGAPQFKSLGQIESEFYENRIHCKACPFSQNRCGQSKKKLLEDRQEV